MPILHIDLESRSAVELDLGVYRYAPDPTTSVLCAAFAIDNGEPQLWWPGDHVPYMVKEAAHDPAWLVCAHNASFEMTMWQNVLLPKHSWPLIDPRRWRCTMAMAGLMSLPQSLKELAEVLDLRNRKDPEGEKLIDELSKLQYPRKVRNKPRGEPYWVNDPVKMQRMGEYCLQDVRVEQELHSRLDPFPPQELEYWLHSNVINDRGVPFDRELAEACDAIAEAALPEVNDEIRKLTDGAVNTVYCHIPLRKWLNERGADIADCRKDTLEPLLEDEDLDGDTRYAVHLRLAGASAAAKKAKAFLDRAVDGDRVKGVYWFAAANTGRYASRGAQFQNLKNSSLETEEQVEAAIAAVLTRDLAHVKSLFPRPIQLLGDIARSMVRAAPGKTLIGCDLSNIESRTLSWCAGQDDKLDQFARHDVTGLDEHETYRITAVRMLGIPIEKVGKTERNTGKTCDLSLGYRGGHRAIAKRLKGVPEDRLKQLVEIWRRLHPKITELWANVERAALRCVRTKQPTTAGPFTFTCDNLFLWVLMPSGRTNYFPFPKLITNDRGNQVVAYQQRDSRTKQWGECNHGRGSYGGLITQNLNQALARDVLCAAMLRAEHAGYRVVMTTHDELTAEVEEGFGSEKELVEIMIEQPSWASGPPLNAKGWEGLRYG